jgi:diguanylate cyclase (GGDEF)-like protein/PAS domain S-box-containing protein/putative nucleotidyltransferase with HDIG domain
LGYTAEELIGKKWQDITHPDDFDVTQKSMENLLSGNKITEKFEKRYLRKDGSIVWGEVHSTIRRDANGKPLYFMTSIIDITDRKRIEEKLKESEIKYKSLFDNSGIGIAVYSPEGRILSFNKIAAQNLGGKTEEFEGKLFIDLFPKEDAELYLSRVTRAIESDEPMEYEDRLALPEGAKWYASTFNKLLDAKGNILGAHVASLDITVRKKAEEDLKESQAILNAALENSEAGIMIVDAPDARIRYVNKAGLFLRDTSDAERIKSSDVEVYIKSWDILHPDGNKYAVDQDPLSRAIKKGEICNEEFILRRAGIEDRYIWAKSAPIHDSNENIIAGIGIFIDVTDRKLDEDKIRKQNDLFATLLELLPVGVFMVDAPEGRPLIANDAALQILGRGILPDANKYNLSHTYKARKRDNIGEYPQEEMPIILGMQGITSHIDDMIVDRPDGTETMLEIFGTPVRNDKGDVWASLVTFMDITKRKNAEENLIYLSYHDFLTGLYNRRFFEEELKRLDTERNLPITIVMADLNGLKLINDSFGHITGDELLKKAGKVIKEAFRSDDLVSRIGGDEFAIMLVKTDAEEAAQIIQRLNARTSNENTGVLDLSISFGYHTKTNKNENILKVMENAENHMYRQKFYERDSVRSKTVEIIMNTLFEKSRREMMHSKRVSEICEAIATEMHLEKANINKIRTAGLVHDIGKIGISENILNKPKKLNEVEWDEIKKHPESGWRILISVKEFSEIADFVLGHHEHWDGSGYPNGLVGDQISLEARIIALADAYDAMTVDRTYRKGLTPQEAITEIKRCSGTQFDPELAHLFISKVVKNLKKRV